MSTFYLLHFCQLHLGPLILKDRKQLEPRDPFFMKTVLKAKKETLDTTPLLCKIKAKAVFEGQETGGERHLQPENSPGGSSTLSTFGRALHGETVCTTMTSSNSPPMATGWRRLRATPNSLCGGPGLRGQPAPKKLEGISTGYGQGQHSLEAWKRGCCRTGTPDGMLCPLPSSSTSSTLSPAGSF